MTICNKAVIIYNMLRFLNVPPKSGEDVEFAPSGIMIIDNANPKNLDDCSEYIISIGRSAARELLENMDNPDVLEVTRICFELAEKTPQLSKDNGWFEEFIVGALRESMELRES